MPQIIRQDEVAFVVYTYREIVAAKKTALLRRELMMLAREHGDFARFYRFPDGDYEAVFSRDPGYLLAENIWQHFGNPADFIYCEQLTDADNALLVVVRNGLVSLDAELPVANLMDEFINLIGGENRFDIYVYGDVPLAEKATENKFAFEPGMVKSFNVLSAPVFPTLETDDSFKLYPVDEALAELPERQSSKGKTIAITIFLLAVVYGVWKTLQTPSNRLTPTPIAPPSGVATAPAIVDPYQGFYTDLTTASPSSQIKAVLDYTQTLLTIPGWTVTSMSLADNTVTYQLTNVGGNTQLLLAWVKQNKADLQITSNQASIIYTLNLASRERPTQIYNLRDTTSLLFDSLREIFPDTSVSLGETADYQVYKTIEINLTFSEVSIQVLQLLANVLQGFPVTIKSFSMDSIDHGIFSGSMDIEVLGAPS